MRRKSGQEIANILIPILYGLMAIVVAMLVCWSGQYPFGSDTMTYIYRGDVVFNAIREGNFLPLYDSMWYNGVEVFGYCAPFPLYFMALCQALAGGNSIDGYLMFTGLVYFMGAMSWFFIGKKMNRIWLGAFVGALWFFMPHNLHTMFMEGNLARALCMVFLPVLIGSVYEYATEATWTKLLKIMLSYVAIALCDFDYVVMVSLGILLFMVVYGIIYREWRGLVDILFSMILSTLSVTVCALPFWVANIDTSNKEVMYKYFQSIIKTLNPLERYASDNGYYYFGLVVFLLIVFGIMCSKKKSLPGLWTGLVLLLLTATSMYPVLKIIPGSNYLLMCQYISVALCFVLYAFLNWETLRKPIQIIICVLLVIDVIPSISLVCGPMNGVPVAERFGEQYQTTMIEKAQEVCQQRIAFLDGGELEATGTYLVSSYENGKPGSYGSDWRASKIQSNLMQLDRAINAGFYPYVFDRCMELGNDTVLIKLSQANMLEVPVEQMDAAAQAVGYKLVDFNEFYRLYDMDIQGSWGTVATYSAIGIGEHAGIISLSFPSVEEGNSDKIDEYTYEELAKYKMIYLSDFTYHDKTKAEELILRLSENGVRIVILADGIPEDSITHAREFLGVSCNDISFSNGYPFLDTKIGVLDPEFFPQGHEEWSTVYVNGLDDVWGTVREEELDLAFCGTVKNDNIAVIGLNLTYYYSLTRDDGVGELIGKVTKLIGGELPKREVVPINVSYKDDYFIISSNRNNVNTSLAYLDIFVDNEYVIKKNNLVYVNEGVTYISTQYPYIYIGLILTIIGIGASVFFLYIVKKRVS
ncbi:MAG: hypothetical protein IJB96_00815 [Lachnospira sp.]|nr:hypothetical protein [Lachnospira sp.]